MNVLREHLHVLDRRRRQDAVTEIEDVPRTAADASEDVCPPDRSMRAGGPSSNVGSRLPCTPRSKPICPTPRRSARASRRRSRRRPPHAAPRASSPCPYRNESSAPGCATDVEDLLRVGQRELAIVGGAQRPDPRVEHLHRVDAGFDLRARDSRRRRRRTCRRADATLPDGRTSATSCVRSCSSGRPRSRTTPA